MGDFADKLKIIYYSENKRDIAEGGFPSFQLNVISFL